LGISKERNLSELMAAEDGKLAVKDSTLTADIEASWAARINESNTRRDITTAHWVKTDRAADGAAETSNISFFSDTLIEIVDLNVIVDLTKRFDAEAALESRRHANLNTVLVDLNIGTLEDFISLAEETRAWVKKTLDAKELLHALIKLSTINNTNKIRILSIKSSTRHYILFI